MLRSDPGYDNKMDWKTLVVLIPVVATQGTGCKSEAERAQQKFIDEHCPGMTDYAACKMRSQHDAREAAIAAAKEKATAAAVAPAAPPPVLRESLPPDDAARDTAGAIRSAHPLACAAAAADNDWATCHDEMKGFDNVLRCAQGARTKARSALARFPALSPRSECGKVVATASREMVAASTKMLADLVAWLEKNRARLTAPLANQAMSDACIDVKCDDKPSQFDGLHDHASYAHVSQIECTKSMFQCGRAANNECLIFKVADRLGVACDATENKLDDPLTVRSTGTPIRQR